MAFRNIKSKVKAAENRLHRRRTTVPNVNARDIDLVALQNDVKSAEQMLNRSVKHILMMVDANIEDVKASIEEKQSEDENYSPSMCDIWYRLKSVEKWDPKVVNLVRMYQLRREKIRKPIKTMDNNINIQGKNHLIILKHRSRLAHLHICEESDEFNSQFNSYIGLILFSYDNKMKFKLNGHHCQRGDIIIKRTTTLDNRKSHHREKYDVLFKWYFNRWIDERFLGQAFWCIDGKWHFETINFLNPRMSPYEHRIVDMFLLTRWLTKTTLGSTRSIQEMEKNARELLFKQHEQTVKALAHQQQSGLANVWLHIIGGNASLLSAIANFNAIAWEQIEIKFENCDLKKNSNTIKIKPTKHENRLILQIKMTNIFEKLWKRFQNLTTEDQQFCFDQERRIIFGILDEFKGEMQTTVETIEKRVYSTRPATDDVQQWRDYQKRIESAKDLLHHIEHFLKRIFDTFIEFFERQWDDDSDRLKILEQQKITFNIYNQQFNLIMEDWNVILNKIDQLNEELKK